VVIGLTGAIGSGKSTVASLFSDAGFAVVDCDAISRGLDAEPKYTAAVRDAFGDGVVDMSGGTARIARKELAEIVFSSAEAKKKIESIAHPIILEIVCERVDAAKRLKKDIVIDAPLLFESGLDDICDITVGVVTDEKLRFERAMKRGGITEDNLRRRMELQPKNEFYASRCDYIIENDGTADDLKVAFRRVLSAVGKGGANDG
jgi:dephospho-CoA kinase